MSDTENWIEMSGAYITGDVVRWTENIWSKKKRGRGKSAKNVLIGKQLVTGQIKEISSGYLHIKVLEVEMLEADGAKESRLHPVGEVIVKKPATLSKGNALRLLWTDEENRANILLENK